jgi:hypothetical protein
MRASLCGFHAATLPELRSWRFFYQVIGECDGAGQQFRLRGSRDLAGA